MSPPSQLARKMSRALVPAEAEAGAAVEEEKSQESASVAAKMATAEAREAGDQARQAGEAAAVAAEEDAARAAGEREAAMTAAKVERMAAEAAKAKLTANPARKADEEAAVAAAAAVEEEAARVAGGRDATTAVAAAKKLAAAETQEEVATAAAEAAEAKLAGEKEAAQAAAAQAAAAAAAEAEAEVEAAVDAEVAGAKVEAGAAAADAKSRESASMAAKMATEAREAGDHAMQAGEAEPSSMLNRVCMGDRRPPTIAVPPGLAEQSSDEDAGPATRPKTRANPADAAAADPPPAPAPAHADVGAQPDRSLASSAPTGVDAGEPVRQQQQPPLPQRGFVVFCRGYGSEQKAAAEARAVLQPLLPAGAGRLEVVPVAHRGIAVLGLDSSGQEGGCAWRPSAVQERLCASLLQGGGKKPAHRFRFCIRIAPVDGWVACGDGGLDGLGSAVAAAVAEAFPAEGCRYAVAAIDRGDDGSAGAHGPCGAAEEHGRLIGPAKREVIMAAAGAVPERHRVDLRRPERVLVLVQLLLHTGQRSGVDILPVITVGVLDGRHCSRKPRLRPMTLPATAGSAAAQAVELPSEAAVADRAAQLFPTVPSELQHLLRVNLLQI